MNHKLLNLIGVVLLASSSFAWPMYTSYLPDYTPIEFSDDQEPIPTPVKNTVLQALNYGDVERAIELVKQGTFDPNERNLFGRSPLLEAYNRIREINDFVSAFKQLGRNNVEKELEKEPLYQLLELMLQKGANPFEKISIKMASGVVSNRSLYDDALRYKDQRLVGLIKKYYPVKSLTSLSLQSIIQAVEGGEVSLEDIKEEYPEAVYKQIEDVVKQSN